MRAPGLQGQYIDGKAADLLYIVCRLRTTSCRDEIVKNSA